MQITRIHIYLAFPLVAFLISIVSCNEETFDLPSVVDFNYHIRPILSDRCFACHGPDENTRKAKLSLHTEAGAKTALEMGAGLYIIDPGDPASSVLYHRISSDDPDYMMPPPESNLLMSKREVALIEKWIKQGALWKKHWSFIPPQRPTPPASPSDWKAEQAIDQFTFDKMREQGLKKSAPATRAKRIRRLFFDLNGLPPSLDQIQAFENDTSANAYEKVVDQALSAPAYGERMATDWLDLARYADSHGYQDDRPRTMWPWRNWLIEAFNKNQSYDEFVTWQLAGDLLENPTYEQKLATGFNRNHSITQEGGVINEEYLTEYAVDRTDVFATGFLGLTMQCARCHDHKYDPITQEDFYQVFAFFNNLKNERGQISYSDLAPVPSMQEENPEWAHEIEAIKATIAGLEGQMVDLKQATPEGFNAWRSTFEPDQFKASSAKQEVHYTLDDSAGTSFKNALDPTQQGRVNINLPPSIDLPNSVPGKYGMALEFNGDNFLTLGDIGDFDHYQSFSLGAWIRHTGKLKKQGGILARRNGEQNRQGYDLFMNKDGSIGMRLIHKSGGKYLEIKTNRALPKHQWQHVVATYNGSGKANGVQIFINGSQQRLQVIRDSLHGQSILTGNNFLVGHWNHRARNIKTAYGFEGGAIDEIMVFGRQLSALEIQQIFHNKTRSKSPLLNDQKSHYILNHSLRHRTIQDQLDSLRAIDLSVPHVMIMEERDTIYPAYVLARGAYDAQVKKVSRSTPTAILKFDEKLPKDRLGLANWLFDPANPLTARVMVNRLWQQCFGRGLVATPEDFGSQGSLPSHPALLDWLAVEFQASDWNIKHMLKLMVLSSTYQQTASIEAHEFEIDKANIWLARGSHLPLTAEMLRDQALKVSGLLNPKLGGKWVKPYQPAGIWKELANQTGENKYRISQGSDLYRRSIYTYWKRTIPPPTMITLDAPERAVCTVRRQVTNTPLQALILLNDPQYVEASRVLAEKLMKENRSDKGKDEIKSAFRLITSRIPTTLEVEKLLALYLDLKADFQDNPDFASDWLSVGKQPTTEDIEENELAAMTAVISTIFNLDESKYN